MPLLWALGYRVLEEKEGRACSGSGWLTVHSEQFTCAPQSGSSWLPLCPASFLPSCSGFFATSA